MDYRELKEKAKELEKKYKITYYEVLQRFMFERMLERISKSKYNENFILKGGLLLSAIFGINNRSTQDMDTTIKGIDISKENMEKVIKEILNIDLKDGIKFEYVNVEGIREDNEYGGDKYNLIGHLENLKIRLSIDISTGDMVTPRELDYEYPMLFENRKIHIYTYNNETILAEKIETILHRGIYNSRMKDYYDVYMFVTEFKDTIDEKIFVRALKNTFIKRNSEEMLVDYKQILDEIKSSERIKGQWNTYARKNIYAKGIEFEDIIVKIRKILDEPIIQNRNNKNRNKEKDAYVR